MIGFTPQALSTLFSNGRSAEGNVTAGMIIHGDCCHVKDESYGELRGQELIDCAEKSVKMNLLGKMPLNCVKDERSCLSYSKKHSKNFGGAPLTVSKANNLKQTAKKLLLRSYGLSVNGNAFGNIYEAGKTIMEKDSYLRRQIGDNTDDYRGILRQCNLSAGDDDVKVSNSMSVKITLFNKTQVSIFHHTARTERMTLHLDGTGFKADLGIHLGEGVTMLHHIGSINGNAFVVGSDERELL